jgi:hypothetical protein
MPDALLVAEQHVKEGFLPSAPPWSVGAREQLTHGGQMLQAEVFTPERGSVHNELNFWRSENSTTVDVHVSRVQAAMKFLEGLRQSATREREFRLEAEWLAENKRRYSGQWIALKGDQLLAVGATAKEVFLKVSDQSEPPLVIRVDEQDLPFAGW